MAKEDLEMAVVKALSQAPLSIDEALQVLETDSSEIIAEFGLTVGESNKVFNWLKHEALRHINQSQMDTTALHIEEGRKQRIGKSELRGMILEELQLEAGPNMDMPHRLISEQWGADSRESLSPLVAFGQAWSGLGGAVQEQIISVVNGFIENNQEDVYEINPNALDMAVDRLRQPLFLLNNDGQDGASEVLEALEWAQGIFEQGDAEVDADRAAAMGESDY